MLRATHTAAAIKMPPVRTARCQGCGTEITFTTKPRKWCALCDPHQHHRPDGTLYPSSMGLAQRYEQYVSVPVVAAPGFCRICGVTRLSVADTDGACLGCKEEARL